jgi:hypothetical protein
MSIVTFIHVISKIILSKVFLSIVVVFLSHPGSYVHTMISILGHLTHCPPLKPF